MTLQEILTQVAEGKLSVADAERLIRQGPPRALRPQKGRLVGLVFLGFGILFGGIGIFLGYDAWTFASAAHTAEGTVIELVRGEGKRGGTFAPVVRYEVAGVGHQFKSSVASSPPAYAVGDKVTILFHPDNPGDGRIQSFVNQWLFPSVFSGFGLLFTVIGLAVCVRPPRHVSSA